MAIVQLEGPNSSGFFLWFAGDSRESSPESDGKMSGQQPNRIKAERDMKNFVAVVVTFLCLSIPPVTGQAGTIQLALEEPEVSGIYNGVGNIRGWAVSTDGISRVDLYVDGLLVQSMPYGGLRNDVANVYPSYPGSSLSGFSMAYNYSNLASGSHSITVVAVDTAGATLSDSATFQVDRFDSSFISDASQVTLGSSSVSIQSETVLLNNVMVQGTPYNVQLKWNNPAQGWRAISIAREGGVQGSISGKVVDAVSGNPVSGASVKVYKGAGVLQAIAETNTGGDYSVNLPAGQDYEAEVSKTDYLSTSYKSVRVVENETTFLETVRQIGTEFDGVGTATGVLTNALDGSPITDATLYFRSGLNALTGTIVATATTGFGTDPPSLAAMATPGEYEVSLDAGNYTAEISAPGFDPAYFSVYGLGNRVVASQNGTAIPTLSEGETRIVLTWGTTVADLDAHTTGPTGRAGERFHVYWLNKTEEYVDLDLDDTLYQGPETTTIRHQLSGVYRFSVHDFSNRSKTSSTELSNSGARVEVYRAGGLAASFNVPNNQGGTLWTVFEMNGNVITPVNSMTYESSYSTIQGVGETLPPVDAYLLTNLPDK